MSATGGKEKWLTQWTTHPRSVTLLLNWDSRRGVLLASHDESADETIPKVVELISPDYTVEVSPSFSNTQWEEAVAILTKKQIQWDIFSGPLPKRVCLIIRGLDQCPEWMLNRLQGFLNVLQDHSIVWQVPTSLGKLIASIVLSSTNGTR